jgi:DNA-binding MarR family transcriptional regulator
VSHNQDHLRRILEEIEAGNQLSQRALAARLGIALGHTNNLLKCLVEKRWVQVIPDAGQGFKRVRYVVTVAGAEARIQMSQEFLSRAVASFATVKDRIRQALNALTPPPTPSGGHPRAPTIAVYGTGDIAHIAYGCAVEAGVPLIGFVDDVQRVSFLGLPVCASADLKPLLLDGRPFDWLLIASLSDDGRIRSRLEGIGFPLDRVSWLLSAPIPVPVATRP